MPIDTQVLYAKNQTRPNQTTGIGVISNGKFASRVFDATDGAITLSYDASAPGSSLFVTNEDKDGLEYADFNDIGQINRIFIQNHSVASGLFIDIDGSATLQSESGLILLPTGGGYAQFDLVEVSIAIKLNPASATGKYSVLAFW